MEAALRASLRRWELAQLVRADSDVAARPAALARSGSMRWNRGEAAESDGGSVRTAGESSEGLASDDSDGDGDPGENSDGDPGESRARSDGNCDPGDRDTGENDRGENDGARSDGENSGPISGDRRDSDAHTAQETEEGAAKGPSDGPSSGSSSGSSKGAAKGTSNGQSGGPSSEALNGSSTEPSIEPSMARAIGGVPGSAGQGPQGSAQGLSPTPPQLPSGPSQRVQAEGSAPIPSEGSAPIPSDPSRTAPPAGDPFDPANRPVQTGSPDAPTDSPAVLERTDPPARRGGFIALSRLGVRPPRAKPSPEPALPAGEPDPDAADLPAGDLGEDETPPLPAVFSEDFAGRFSKPPSEGDSREKPRGVSMGRRLKNAWNRILDEDGDEDRRKKKRREKNRGNGKTAENAVVAGNGAAMGGGEAVAGSVESQGGAGSAGKKGKWEIETSRGGSFGES